MRRRSTASRPRNDGDLLTAATGRGPGPPPGIGRRAERYPAGVTASLTLTAQVPLGAVAISAHLFVAGTVGATPPRAPAGTDLATYTLAELLHRPAWQRDAACHEHPEVSWFPMPGQSAGPAEAICAGCLVRAECAAAGELEEAGVWGGEVHGDLLTAAADELPAVVARIVANGGDVAAWFGRERTPKRTKGRPAPIAVRCSCGKKCRTPGIWQAHRRGALEAHPGTVHQLIAG
jgi:hypothetical protein